MGLRDIKKLREPSVAVHVLLWGSSLIHTDNHKELLVPKFDQLSINTIRFLTADTI
jgi:hypothetical protein